MLEKSGDFRYYKNKRGGDSAHHPEDISLSDHVSEHAIGRSATTPPPGAHDETKSDALLALVLASLDQEKAEDVVAIDLRGRTAMADHMVIATGRSTRQVAALADKLIERLKHDGDVIARAEGKEAADWVLIDAGDIIVHVFRPEVREFYQLEKMWSEQTRPAKAVGRA